MRLKLFEKGDSVLLLGESNFTFAVDLRKHNLPIFLTACCAEPEMTYDVQQENIAFLESQEVPCYLEVEPTKVHEHPFLNVHHFSKIVYNFPHPGKELTLENCQNMLKDIFTSVKPLLKDNGKMIITLCNGLGGTTFDRPQRKYEETWQIEDMAAMTDFMIAGVEPFEGYNFINYTLPPYKAKDFSIPGSLVHVFAKSFVTGLYQGQIDESVSLDRLVNSSAVVTNQAAVEMPPLYAECYEANLIQQNQSAVKYFADLLYSSMPRNVVELDDNDVPLHIQKSRGVAVTVDGIESAFRLRSSPTEILCDVIHKWETVEPGQLLLFPGIYFDDVPGKDFNNKSVANYQFLMFGKDALATTFRYLSKLAKSFSLSNVSVTLRPITLHDDKQALPQETVQALNKQSHGLFTAKSGTEWVYTFQNEEQPDVVVGQNYVLEYKNTTLQASIIFSDKLSEFFLKIDSWRQQWSRQSFIETETGEDGIARPVLKQRVMTPPEFEFEVTMKTFKDFDEAKFFETLWLAAANTIVDVQHEDTVCKDGFTMITYKIKYKSMDTPLYRKRVLDIHTKIVGKMLVKALGVTIV